MLVATADTVGLDGPIAREVLASGRYADEVRAAERRWRAAGINAAPAVVIDERHLVSGGQPPKVFESGLRKVAAETA